jgi:hypothetical protein
LIVRINNARNQKKTFGKKCLKRFPDNKDNSTTTCNFTNAFVINRECLKECLKCYKKWTAKPYFITTDFKHIYLPFFFLCKLGCIYAPAEIHNYRFIWRFCNSSYKLGKTTFSNGCAPPAYRRMCF